MDLDTARPVTIALLCVLAIALAAATLNTAVTDESGGGIGFGDSGSAGMSDTNGSEGHLLNGSEQGASVPIDFPCYPVLNTFPAILGIVAVFLLVVALAWRRLGPLGAFAVIGPVGVPALLLHALLTACAAPPMSGGGFLPGGQNNSSLPMGGSGGLGEGTSTVLTPSFALLVILGVALVGALFLLVRTSAGSELEDPDDEGAYGNEPDVAAVGRAAGEAADRIESSESVENEVYRAWREMTTHLDVPAPQSSTPGEFADSATDAGMAREDVTELTNLFEEVRYGGESPTGERERRAVAALRNIEAEYADGLDDSGGGIGDSSDAWSSPDDTGVAPDDTRDAPGDEEDGR